MSAIGRIGHWSAVNDGLIFKKIFLKFHDVTSDLFVLKLKYLKKEEITIIFFARHWCQNINVLRKTPDTEYGTI